MKKKYTWLKITLVLSTIFVAYLLKFTENYYLIIVFSVVSIIAGNKLWKMKFRLLELEDFVVGHRVKNISKENEPPLYNVLLEDGTKEVMLSKTPLKPNSYYRLREVSTHDGLLRKTDWFFEN